MTPQARGTKTRVSRRVSIIVRKVNPVRMFRGSFEPWSSLLSNRVKFLVVLSITDSNL